jgi:hypothetical protein
MSNIPEARSDLRDLVTKHPELADEIAPILAKMVRRPYAKPRTRSQSRTMTPRLARKIRSHCAKYPGQSVQEVAEIFDVNPGRISDALHGDI